MTNTFDLVLGGVARFHAESPWARRLIERHARSLDARSRREIWEHRPTMADFAGDSASVLVQVDPEAFLLPAAALRLLATLESQPCDLVIPVTNEPWCEGARDAPPFPYHTPSMLEEVVEWMAAHARPPRRLDSAASPLFAARREALASLPQELPLDRVVQEACRRGLDVFVDPGAYAHRYGEMDGQARADLAANVPRGSRAVLDVGCSRGATARLLRQAGVERIVGIEPDPGDAAEAGKCCDRVIAEPLEAVTQDFTGQFDAILFGDVLEHLIDPSDALEKVRPWLSPRGVVIASVPNLGHWSVVADLLEGRFDYIPYSVLSGTHVRFFTRRTLEDLFAACGYHVETIDTVKTAPSPRGVAKLARLTSMPGACADLENVEFIAVARAGSESQSLPSGIISPHDR